MFAQFGENGADSNQPPIQKTTNMQCFGLGIVWENTEAERPTRPQDEMTYLVRFCCANGANFESNQKEIPSSIVLLDSHFSYSREKLTCAGRAALIFGQDFSLAIDAGDGILQPLRLLKIAQIVQQKRAR